LNSYEYLKIVILKLSNIIYNSTQGKSITKDEIIDLIISIIEDYNRVVDSKDKIKINDFRRK
jgi:hypothetical protein